MSLLCTLLQPHARVRYTINAMEPALMVDRTIDGREEGIKVAQNAFD